ncbi:hypothetical protein CKO42_08250 [Lamprobacter modestohalophilus]|uniref:Uncharacterized protein n=1 Tax=Lamprobacter modestohalophilus TaxID=1064514 RepID=A0A9X0W7U1_9GAMM|nr:hypothetical protein [Lamprobacter modestohalophilus]
MVPRDAEVLAVDRKRECVNLVGELEASLIIVARDDQARRSALPDLLDRAPDETMLVRVQASSCAGIAGVLIRMSGGRGERIDAALGDHQRRVGLVDSREPQPFVTPFEKSVKLRFFSS